MSTKPKLGRGLGALIRDESPVTPPPADGGSVIHTVPITSIRPNPLQPRRHFEPEALAGLVESIREHGVLQPLLVRSAANGYELIAGERRLRASQTAGLREIPVIVMAARDDQSLELALVENLQRENLDPIEEAEGYQVLMDRFTMTQEQVAVRVGKARATVANALRLLSLPDEVRLLVSRGALSAGHAKLLSGLPIAEEQVLLARQVVQDNLSVRQLESLIRRRQRTTGRKARVTRDDIPANHLQLLTDKLHQHFGTSVRLYPSRTLANGKKVRGQLVIDYLSNDDLDRILDLLGIRIE
ncbi:MAG: hypothetical protein A2498_06925 [Lentisphaerae bacterium RIFOXYC12_FULL_60_16]|nr:MAG: hypothetical protein A2498_06925 [Lentisphaerae bacterium RIFOXYC12_FULL_60_16]